MKCSRKLKLIILSLRNLVISKKIEKCENELSCEIEVQSYPKRPLLLLHADLHGLLLLQLHVDVLDHSRDQLGQRVLSPEPDSDDIFVAG